MRKLNAKNRRKSLDIIATWLYPPEPKKKKEKVKG